MNSEQITKEKGTSEILMLLKLYAAVWIDLAPAQKEALESDGYVCEWSPRNYIYRISKPENKCNNIK
jgi:hypothetical protein